jgi:hypothetical protein
MDTPELCAIDACVGMCGLWHACRAQCTHSAGKLLPVAEFVAGSSLSATCTRCRAAKNKNRRDNREAARAQGEVLHTPFNLQRTAARAAARAQGEVLRTPADLQRTAERAAARAQGEVLRTPANLQRTAERAAEKAARAAAVPEILGFQHDAREVSFIVDCLLDTIRVRLDLRPEDAAYILALNGIPIGADAARVEQELWQEGARFLCAGRAGTMQLIASKADGSFYTETELRASGLVDIKLLYVNDHADGGGQAGVEGVLMERIAQASGGYGAQSGGALLNQTNAPSGGTPAKGFFQACASFIIRGGLPAIGARLRDKEGRDVSSWPLGGGGGGGGASSSSSSASAANDEPKPESEPESDEADDEQDELEAPAALAPVLPSAPDSAAGSTAALGIRIAPPSLRAAAQAAAAPAAAAAAAACVPRLVVPQPLNEGEQPRPSGASFWRESETYEAFLARLAARWERWAALHNLERLAYKLRVLQDDGLVGAPLEGGGGGGGGAGAAGGGGGGGGGWLLEQYYLQEPRAPAGFLAGIEELAASGAVDILREGFVYRALSAPEADAVRASQAAPAGAPEAHLPLLLARPQHPPTAEEASVIMVEQAKYGSCKNTNCVSLTHGSGYICMAMSETAVEGGKPGRMVIRINVKDVQYGVFVRVGSSGLMAKKLSAEQAAFVKGSEVYLFTFGGIGVYEVVVDKGEVLPGCSLGPLCHKPRTPWYVPPAPPLFAGAVFCLTNLTTVEKKEITAAIVERGGSVKGWSGKVTAVVADEKLTGSVTLREANKRPTVPPVITLSEMRHAITLVQPSMGAAGGGGGVSSSSSSSSAATASVHKGGSSSSSSSSSSVAAGAAAGAKGQKRARKASDSTTLPASRASEMADAPAAAAAAAAAAAQEVVGAAALSPKLQAPLPSASECASSASKRAKKK